MNSVRYGHSLCVILTRFDVFMVPCNFLPNLLSPNSWGLSAGDRQTLPSFCCAQPCEQNILGRLHVCTAANTLHDTPLWGCLNMWLRVGRGDTLNLEDGSSIKWATEGKSNSLQTRRQVGRHLYLQFDRHLNHKHYANNKTKKTNSWKTHLFS